MRRCRLTIPVLLLGLGATACGTPDPLRLAEDLRETDSPALREALQHGSVETRARAALAMGRIQSPSYAEPLAAAAASDRRPLRLAALFALGQLGLARGAEPPGAAVDACRAALADADPGVAARAVEALGKLAPPDAASTIVPLLRHDSPEVRAEAALALFRLRFVPVWRGQAEEPPPLPDEAVTALIANLADPDERARWAAVYAFSRFGQPRAVEALAQRLEDSNEWARLFAARALGRSGDAAGAGPLLAGLDDPSPRVRSETVVALSALGAVRRLPAELARDDSFHVRAAVAAALGTDDDPGSLDALRALERDASPTVRAAAVEGLARRLGPAYRETLDALAADESWRIRVAAARAAARLDAAQALPLLRRAAADPDARVRCAALEGLPDEGGWELVTAALGSDDLAERGTAVARVAGGEHADRLPLLTAAYDQSPGVEWIEVRESIVDALGELPAAQPLLERIAGADDAPAVRDRARLALAARGLDAPEPEPAGLRPSPLLEVAFDEDPLVVLETSQGEISIRCLSRQAPVHVANFVELVRGGFYDGLPWHRVVSNFVIQGGDPRGDGWGSAGYTLRDEINTQRYVRGAVGMPKAGKDTGSCQLFITHTPTPHLDGNYTVFGLVTSGLEVVDRIEVGDTILRARVE